MTVKEFTELLDRTPYNADDEVIIYIPHYQRYLKVRRIDLGEWTDFNGKTVDHNVIIETE